MDKERTEPESLPIARWVIEVIESCNNAEQMELCENLITFYQLKFHDKYIDDIQQAFDVHSLKTNYDKYKQEKEEEKHKVFITENEVVS